MSCPFINKDMLARLPEDKKEELERYYNELVKQPNALLTDISKQMDGERCPVMKQNSEGDDERPVS